MAVQKEARGAARRVLRCPALLTLPGGATVKARTFDVSMSGISLMLDGPLAAGERYMIAFEAFAAGKVLKINVAARAIHCALSGTEGFRVGFQFEHNDEAALKAIRQLLS